MRFRNIAILSAVALIMGAAIFAALFLVERVDRNTVYVNDPRELIPPQYIPQPEPEHPALADIRALAEKNAQIGSVECDLVVQVQAEISLTLKGYLALEKPNKFRMTISRRWGNKTEFDMGSNTEKFWFWSRRMDPPALYWATHKNANNTRLKTPFNPVWMMESMSGDIVMDVNTSIERYHTPTSQYWKIIKKAKGAHGEGVLRISLLDPEKKAVVANYVVNELTGRPMTTTEVTSWRQGPYGYTAKTIKIIWHDEDMALELELVNPKTNARINPKNWIMPDRNPKIDISRNGIL
tara:strand:+ start:503 stop:1387 length:885 start_codon:yes stop_codon:yes gene_type:complete